MPDACNQIESPQIRSSKPKNCTSEFVSSSEFVPGVSILTINIQCLMARKVELEISLALHRPHAVVIQKTWLTKSTECEWGCASFAERPQRRSCVKSRWYLDTPERRLQWPCLHSAEQNRRAMLALLAAGRGDNLGSKVVPTWSD